jgi:hypothetical protein
MKIKQKKQASYIRNTINYLKAATLFYITREIQLHNQKKTSSSLITKNMGINLPKLKSLSH